MGTLGQEKANRKRRGRKGGQGKERGRSGHKAARHLAHELIVLGDGRTYPTQNEDTS
jgi:hypothetical protein